MSTEDNKRVVANFVEVCQNQHDLAAADNTEIWDLPPTGESIAFEFIDIFRIKDGKLFEHWTSIDLAALRSQMQPGE